MKRNIFYDAFILILLVLLVAGSCTAPVETPVPTTTPQPQPGTKSVMLRWDNDIPRGFFANLGGFLVEFPPPDIPFTINKVRIVGVLAGQPLAQDFKVQILNHKREVLYDADFPVNKFSTSPKAVYLDIPGIVVNDWFAVHVYIGTGVNEGVHIGVDDSIVNEHSKMTLQTPDGFKEAEWNAPADSWLSDEKKCNWMIRVGGTYLEERSEESVP